MDGLDVLFEYFECFKEILEVKAEKKELIDYVNKIINMFKTSKERSGKIIYVDAKDFKQTENIINVIDSSEICNLILKKYNTTIEEYKDNDNIPFYVKDIITNTNKGIDNIMYDVILNFNKYNVYFMNKKVRSIDKDAILESDLSVKDSINVRLKDVLLYLEVDIDNIDSNLLKDLNKYIDVDKLHERAVTMKSGIGFIHFMYDKIKDKEVLLTILLHSNDFIINSVKEVFDKYNVNLNKAIDSIPSIFIKEPINSKCKYKFPEKYDCFMNNVKLIEENGIDFKAMVHYPVFLINDSDKNRIVLEKFKSMNVNIKNIYEHVGSIVAINPNLVLKNIEILKQYGIELTDDNNNNGYTLLGMLDLSDELDYLIEKGLWKKSDGINVDNIDLIRGLIIKDDYLMWKNNIKRVKLDNTSFEKKFKNDIFCEDKLNQIYEKNPDLKNIINSFDEKFLNFEDNYYDINGTIVSRNRLLRNISNYVGKGTGQDIFYDSLNYNSNLNEEINDVLKKTLEMGDKSVKLS